MLVLFINLASDRCIFLINCYLFLENLIIVVSVVKIVKAYDGIRL